jgi:hypothetical protein
MGYDSRLSCFRDGVSASSSRPSRTNSILRDQYGGRCLLCDETTGVGFAHIVASAKELNFKSFGVENGYIDELDVSSPRNFIPLCGSKGDRGTCHDEFDSYRIALFYNPFGRNYTVHCLDDKFKDGAIHGKVVNISGPCHPYRRLLAWRSRKCALANQYLFKDKREYHEEYLGRCNFCEGSSTNGNSGDGSAL